MKYRIHFKWRNGTEDDIVLEGDTEQQIKEKAMTELAKRDAEYQWSEPIEE